MEAEEAGEPRKGYTSLIDIVFSWSVEDVLNDDLYKDKVEQIPKIFSSNLCYMNSFTSLLIEETRADLCSSMNKVSTAPTYEILETKHEPHANMSYDIQVGKHNDSEMGVETHEPAKGDLIALTDVKPKCVDDLNRPTRSYTIALVQWVRNEKDYVILHIISSKPIKFQQDTNKNWNKDTLFAVFLTNMTTNIRIWKALNFQLDGKNVRIIDKVLLHDSDVRPLRGHCSVCFGEENYRVSMSNAGQVVRPFNLNESQKEAVLNGVASKSCHHDNTVKLIWGPPGTGKTKTVVVLLYILLGQKCRTITCAPTNVAVLEVAARLLRVVKQSIWYETYGLGDILLFGNRKQMKIDDHSDLLNIFLDYRVKILAKCFAVASGWRHCLVSLVSLLENPEEQYRLYLRNEKDEEGDEEEEEVAQERGILGKMNVKYAKDKVVWREVIAQTSRNSLKRVNWNRKYPTQKEKQSKIGTGEKLNFEDFFRTRFSSKRKFMKFCVVNLISHLPTSCISEGQVSEMISALNLLQYLGASLYSDDIKNGGQGVKGFTVLNRAKEEVLQILKSLHDGFFIPTFFDEYSIKKFCLQNSCLVFCTASSSEKLHTTTMDLLVVDEAAQLKEAESTIPLQIPKLRHTILIGDELQLPAMVRSKISEEAAFGRSLFERLVLLGYKKDLLNVQYRMHPSISLFPNKEFYQKQISDAWNVKQKNYQRHFLTGDIYGSYSFINVSLGKEEITDGHSMQNMVEVAVVSEVVSNLFEECIASKQKLSVGIISPYNAQVLAIKGSLGNKYSTDVDSDFSVSVRSIDGFQGGEEDVIIISTVRCNGKAYVGFLSNRQRVNVALTRARHCLWIFGHEATLRNSGSVWKQLITDAKKRGCSYNAEEDKRLGKAIIAALVDIDQIDILLNIDSLLFKKAKWKVHFCSNFWQSMLNIKSIEIRMEVLSLLTELSSGSRGPCNEESPVFMDGKSAQLVELYKVNHTLYIVWSIDIVKEESSYIQVLKVWDISAVSEISNILKHLDYLLGSYTMDLMHLCKFKHMDGSSVVPMTWPVHSNTVRKIRLPGPDPVQHLCRIFASLSLNDE